MTDAYRACLRELPDLKLTRLGEDTDAGLWRCSLPMPPGADLSWQLGSSPTEAVSLGAWPQATESPRRLLLTADAQANQAPELLALEPAKASGGSLPEANLELFASCPDPDWAWDRHFLKISWGGRQLGLVMGMQVGDEVHWWEGCQLVTRQETPFCRIVEMGGAIPRDLFGSTELEKWPGHENPYLHKHNWLNGVLLVRLYANGVCEVLAHHINSRYVDDGLELEDCVPVLGFQLFDQEPSVAMGPYTGQDTEWTFGEIALDMRETARLASEEDPGKLFSADDFLVYQPYRGMSMYSGIFGRQRYGEAWYCQPADRKIPRGMARTLSFSFSLNPDRSPRIARYLPPSWWYGACAELTSKPYLPVSCETFDSPINESRLWSRESILPTGFEAGCMPRSTRQDQPKDDRHEPSWEGELPGGMLLDAWQTGNATDYQNAICASYFIADVATDHAARLIRMHGYAPPAVSLPMQRIHGPLMAWLETGDPYLLETSKSIIDQAYWLHKNSWPRSATGRDACFIRGTVLLYRYLGDDHYRQNARDALTDVLSTQQPDGSFRDQGGGTGIHGWGAYITKPWMCCMAVGGLIDYLDMGFDDDQLQQSLLKLADWFMAERWDQNGVRTWSYKHFCKGERRQYSPREGGELLMPTPGRWHLEYLARILPLAAELSGDSAYFDAYMESFHGSGKGRKSGDHANAQTLQYLPWLKMRLWQARLGANGIAMEPQWFGAQTPANAMIQSPQGAIPVTWQADGSVSISQTTS